MDTIRQIVDIALPDSFDAAKYFMYLLIAIISVLVVSGIFRLSLGKGSILNGAISSTIAILCLYAIALLIYSFGDNLQFLFSPLPFVTATGDHLNIFPIFTASRTEICAEIVNMMILSYLMNLLETWLPKGNKFFSWFGFRFLALAVAICLHYCINIILNNVLKEHILTTIPSVLFGVVLIAFLLGCIKLIIGGALAFLDPFLGLFHTFFFKKVAGKQLMRAMCTTLLLTVLVSVLNHFSYTAISIAAFTLLTLLPIIIFGLLLWYVIAQFL